MSNNVTKGKQAENQALAFLQQKGFYLLEQNYRHAYGEIDLIMKDADCLVFVEVKSLSSQDFGHPEQSIDYKKQQLILSTAEHYILINDWLGEIRFDVIAILYQHNTFVIDHFEDAFY